MDKSTVEKYFGENSQSWVDTSYKSDGFIYPTALARLKKIEKLLEDIFPGAKGDIVDLGCGAGHLCIRLAEVGYTTTGVDQSQSMLAHAGESCSSMSAEVQSRVRLVNRDLLDNGLPSGSFDAVSSLGVIGYLPNDDAMFEEVARLLRPGGTFIVSCRNRLFNMVSLSDYTLKEIEQGGAKGLIEEIRELFQQISAEDTLNFVKSLAAASNQLLLDEWQSSAVGNLESEPTFTSSVEARQHTPKGLLDTAQQHGFKHHGFYGIHPHLLMAGLNQSFPPNIFNHLSSSLDALDHHPASLIWSSVLIGTFSKAP
jgi:2-polyprenyl-3-methyl-5-hydroxy-6-metoxy-1,4-benzoquinol methylase